MVNWILVCWLAASLEGRIWNVATGAPVRKADVVVGTLGGIPVKRAVSDAGGRYSVEGLAAGAYRVAAGHAGFVPALSQGVLVLKADENRKGVDIALHTPAVISGHVFDEEGEPVESVPVTALSRDEVTGVVSIAGIVRTNDLGEYRFAGLQAGAYFIRASSLKAPLEKIHLPAYYPGASEWEGASPVRVGLGGEARDIDLRTGLGKAGSIAGVVHGPGPVRVTVSRKSTDAVMLAVTEAENTAAQDGRFLFNQVAPGTYVLRAEAKQLWGTAEVRVDGGEAHAEFDLHPAGTIEFEANAPINAVLTRGDRYRLGARSVEGGKLRFEDVTPGSWYLQIDSLPEGSFVESVQWGKQDVLGRPFEVGEQPWAGLRIRVSDAGGTLEGEGGSVSLVPEGGGKALEAVADENGHYRIRGIRPGKYRLACSGELVDVLARKLVTRDCK